MEPVTFAAAAIPALIAVSALALAVLLWRNRSFTSDAKVHRSSRWTAGNRLWPTQVAVFPDRVVRWTPRLFGHVEESISVAQVASVRIDSGALFADVFIETTGGTQPIVCHGHWKGDATKIRDAVAEAQRGKGK